MRYRLGFLTISALLLLGGAACNSGRYTAEGFHLPLDGNVERGKTAFVELGCNTCHKVSGADLPGPVEAAVVPIQLGGQSSRRLSDAYLLTAILNPNYHLAPVSTGEITVDGHSRMPAFTDKITARQMVDVIAYLQSSYVIQRFTPSYPMY